MNEYIMSKSMYTALVRAISKGKKLGNPKKAVIDYLNQTAGIKGEIIDLNIEG